MQNPLDTSALQKGALLGLVIFFLFVLGAGLAYGMLSLLNVADLNQAERLFFALVLGPILAVIGMVIYRRVRG